MAVGNGGSWFPLAPSPKRRSDSGANQSLICGLARRAGCLINCLTSTASKGHQAGHSRLSLSMRDRPVGVAKPGSGRRDRGSKRASVSTRYGMSNRFVSPDLSQQAFGDGRVRVFQAVARYRRCTFEV